MPMFVEALYNRLLKKIFNCWPKGKPCFTFFGQEQPIFGHFPSEFSTNFLKFSPSAPKEMQHFPFLKQ